MSYKDYLARNIKLYYIATFFIELVFIIPIFVAYERQFLTFTQMSFLASFRFAVTLLLEMPTGAFADLVGRKISLALGTLTDATGLVIQSFAQTADVYISGTVLRAIGWSFVSGSTTALIYDSLKELGREKEFPKVRSNEVFIVQISIMLASILSGYMFLVWRGLPYFIQAVGSCIGAFIYLIMQEPKIDSVKFTFKNYVQQNINGFKELVKTSEAKNLSFFYVFVGGITWSWQVFFNQVYASAIGYSEVEKGWLFAIIRFVNAIIFLKLLRVDKFLSKEKVFLFFPIIMLFSSFPGLIQNIVINTIMLFTMTLSSTLRFALLDGYTNELFDSKLRATAISSLNFLIGIIFVILVSIFGKILDTSQAYWSLVVSGFLTLFIVVPMGIRLYRNTKKIQTSTLPTPVVGQEISN